MTVSPSLLKLALLPAGQADGLLRLDGKTTSDEAQAQLHKQCLPPDRFLRVHDSYLVGLDAVEELSLLGNHMYELRLSDGQRIPVGRTRYPALRSRLHLDIKVPEE